MKRLLFYLKDKFKKILINNDWFYLLPLFFGLSLLPFRLSILLGISFETRCLLGVFCLTVFFVFKKTIIPYCLNSKLLQSLFQQALEIDNLRLELKFRLENYPEEFWRAFFNLSGFYISYVQFPLYVLYALFNDALMAVVLYLILYSQYLMLRRIFLTPLYDFSESDQIPSPALISLKETLRLEWKDIVANMNFVTLHFFSKGVTNRLPEKVLKHSYTFLGIRFISNTPPNRVWQEAFSKIASALSTGARTAAESVKPPQTKSWTATDKFMIGATAGTLGATIVAAKASREQAQSAKEQAQIAREQLEQTRISNELQIKVQESNDAYKKAKLAEYRRHNQQMEKNQVDGEMKSSVPIGNRVPKDPKDPKALSIWNEDTVFEVTLKKIKSLLSFLFF